MTPGFDHPQGLVNARVSEVIAPSGKCPAGFPSGKGIQGCWTLKCRGRECREGGRGDSRLSLTLPGADPGTDLRGTGMLGLMQILFFVLDSRTLPLARQIFQLSQHETQA